MEGPGFLDHPNITIFLFMEGQMDDGTNLVSIPVDINPFHVHVLLATD